jgi:hypothetical protein
MLARSLEDSFRGLSYPSYKIKLAKKNDEDRRAQANLTRSNFRRHEGFLATSANRTRTLDEIS